MSNPLDWEKRDVHYCYLAQPNNQCWQLRGLTFALDRETLHGLTGTVPDPVHLTLEGKVRKRNTLTCTARVSKDGTKLFLTNDPKGVGVVLLHRYNPAD